MTANIDPTLQEYTKRRRNLEAEKRGVTDLIKSLRAEFKGKLGPDELAAGDLAAKREYESEKKKDRRERIEQLALAL